MSKQKKETKQKKSKKVKISKKNFYVGTSIVLAVALLIVASLVVNLGGSSDSSAVIATVNGENIMQGEVEQIKQAAAQQGQQLDNESALEQVINQRLILQEAQNSGYVVSVEEAESDIEMQLSQQGRTLEDVKSELSTQGESYDEVIKNYAEQLSIQNYIDAEVEVPEVISDEAMQFYEQNKAQLGQGGEAPAFEEVEGQIVSYLESQKQQQEISALLQELRSSANINYS